MANATNWCKAAAHGSCAASLPGVSTADKRQANRLCKEGFQPVGELVPVGATDRPIGSASCGIPRVGDRRRRDACPASPLDVYGAVIDKKVDAKLFASRHLVKRAIQIVVGQADLVEPKLGRRPRVLVAMAGYVDEVASLMPVCHRFHGPVVGSRRKYVVIGMGLRDALDELGAVKLGYVPG